MTVLREVFVADARAWATYIRALRADIARQKQAGELPADLAVPRQIGASLRAVLAAIDALPVDAVVGDLELLDDQRLAAFAAYATTIQSWAEGQHRRGALSVSRPQAAARFWDQVLVAVHLPEEG